MKKILLLGLVLFITQIGFAQKKQDALLDLSSAKIENCTLDEGKTVTSYSHNGRIYLPIESFEGIKGFKLNYSKFEKLGDANQSISNITIVYTDNDGNEKKSTWTFYRTGKKDVYFDSFEIDTKGTTVDITAANVKEVYLGFGKNKKVDVTVSVNK